MRIIGGRDYYDGAQAYGVDKSVVFVRSRFDDCKMVSESLSGLRPMQFRFLTLQEKGVGYRGFDKSISKRGVRYYFKPFVLWFAGKRYAGVRMSCMSETESFLSNQSIKKPKDITFWSLSSLVDQLDKLGYEITKSRCLVNLMNLSAAEDFFSDNCSDAEVNWLIENNVSIAISDADRGKFDKNRSSNDHFWSVNVDGLGDLGFASVLAPYEAYQSLSMWVGGVLPRPGNGMIEIKDDVVKRNKHGFDKWSFKKKKNQVLV